jgi:methyl-accepting chemotaxis protein
MAAQSAAATTQTVDSARPHRLGRVRRHGRDASPPSGALGQSLIEFAQLSSQLGIEVADISGNIDALSASVGEQAKLSGRLKTVAEGIAAGNHQIEAAVEHAHSATKVARDEATGSREVVQLSLSQLSAFVDWVGDTGDQLASVAEALSAITQVTSQIGRIAQQTHILALNASIEAARSGSAGSGFQVIADSVRELADETINAAKDIETTIGPLTARVGQLTGQGERAREQAQAVRESTQSISSMIETVTGALSSADEQVAEITGAAAAIRADVDAFLGSLSDLAGGLDHSSHELNAARERSANMLQLSEKLVATSARTGVRTPDTLLIEAAVNSAAQVSALFTDAIDRGEITMRDLFDEKYEKIQGSDPQQYLTRFAEFTDRVLPAIQEPLRTIDPRVTFGICTDRNGYIPTHRARVSKPQGPDPVWNAANCRNRRIFNDRTGLTCARNTEPFVVQTYRRDMGGGSYVMMKDVSAPIWIRGRHWGGFRIGYTAT